MPLQADSAPTHVTMERVIEDSMLDQHQSQETSTLTHALLASRYVPEPRTYNDAISSPHADDWLMAAESEIQSHNENQTWTLVDAPKGTKILRNRWVWVVKYNGTGNIERFKARLVIKGFLQEYGIDYDEIFAPVVRMEVLRLLLAVAATLDYEIHQMDVKTAFLNGNLDEDIYMYQPEGFVATGKEHMVCKLNKSIYGLKQAPRVWYQTLVLFLETIHFHHLVKDRCVFVGTIDSQTCYIAVYVDDLLIIAPTTLLITKIKSALNERFKMTDLGEVQFLLGWSIERDRSNRKLFQ
jgi:hypothetical protein